MSFENYIIIDDDEYEFPLEKSEDNNKLINNAKSIVLPKCISDISNSRFEDYTKLKSLDISECDIKMIPKYMCLDCINLNNIDFPSTLRYIENGAFRNCEKLRNVFIPKSVVEIYDEAFENCKSLTNINFDDNSELMKINKFAFSNCEKLDNIILPRNVNHIDKGAFLNCESLKIIGLSDYTYKKVFEYSKSLKFIGLKGKWEFYDLDIIDIDKEYENYKLYKYIKSTSKFDSCNYILYNISNYHRFYDSYVF